MKALIAFEDGRIFEGRSFTGPGEAVGEVVFNTAMTGYQEILTDPSYKGQIVTMTYPLIGNYGVNLEDVESDRIHLEAFLVKEYEDDYSNWRAVRSLREYLTENGRMGIEGLDTRAITRHVRIKGAMKAVVSTEDLDPKRLIKRAQEAPSITGRDLVKEVTAPAPYIWEDGQRRFLNGPLTKETLSLGNDQEWLVACLDCGLKYNQLRLFTQRGIRPICFPATASPEEIMAVDPHGLFLSNGPGDPSALPYVVETVKALIGKLPIFGICLGHQILGQALGGSTYKLKFGHHGANQPVKDLETGRIEITSQNHGFAVDPGSFEEKVAVTHINLNDQTVEGINAPHLHAFSVQYHPENAPGPHDSEYLFDRFLQRIRTFWG